MTALNVVVVCQGFDHEQAHYARDVIPSFLEIKMRSLSQSNSIELGTNMTSQRGPDKCEGNDVLPLKQTNWTELSVDVPVAFTPPCYTKPDKSSPVQHVTNDVAPIKCIT
jgi:hypothetical protein